MFSLEKQTCIKVTIFDQNHGLTLCKNANFSTFWKWLFYSLERLFLSLKHYLEVFQRVFSIKTDMHESYHFWPKSWVNPLQKFKFFDFLKMTFLQFRKAGFVSKTLFTIIPRCFLWKNRDGWRFKFFDQKHLAGWPKTPFAKMEIFLPFLKWPFYSLKTLVFSLKHY